MDYGTRYYILGLKKSIINGIVKRSSVDLFGVSAGSDSKDRTPWPTYHKFSDNN